MSTTKVLDVGQCNADHTRIRALIEQNFDATVDRADLLDDAVDALAQNKYDLVLVNRLFDADQTDGLEVLRVMKTRDDLPEVPLMMITNFPDAQQRAMGEGATQGFGKGALGAPETLELLGQYLPARS